MKRLILGSQSPRRREILSFFSIPFEQIASHFAEELVPFEGDPVLYAKTLAEGKAASLAPRFPKAALLTADTVVFKEGKLFAKPKDETHALEMLSEFNGKEMRVFTGITARLGNHVFSECEETRVRFHSLTDAELHLYHKAFFGRDIAGGYYIQSGGSVIIKEIQGCNYNVMGLPITTTRLALKEVGIDLWHYLS